MLDTRKIKIITIFFCYTKPFRRQAGFSSKFQVTNKKKINRTDDCALLSGKTQFILFQSVYLIFKNCYNFLFFVNVIYEINCKGLDLLKGQMYFYKTKIVTFPCGILGQVWYLIVSFPDLCCLSYTCTSKETLVSEQYCPLAVFIYISGDLEELCAAASLRALQNLIMKIDISLSARYVV